MIFSKINWRLRKSRRKVKGSLRIFDPGDCQKTVYLAGCARSGTTWIADIMNYDNRYRLIIEPFDPPNVDLVSHFNYNQYLRPSNRDKKFVGPAKQIISGQVKNKIDRLNRKILVKERLIKDIRTNFLLKWIKANFPETPIIFLLSHPCAVAYSRINCKFGTHFEEVIFDQPELIENFIYPFLDEINNAQTEFEKHIFHWRIQNYVPLKQFKAGQIQIVFYENFCMVPEEEIKKMFLFLNQDYDQTILETIKRPSTTSRKSSMIFDGSSKKTSTPEQHATGF